MPTNTPRVGTAKALDTASPPTKKPEESASRPGRQKLVFTDPVALRYLEEDPSTTVLHRRLTLQGYEIYIVEQWACSRIHPTFAITTYTGDPSHTVYVGVLSVPTDETTWSPRLKLYYNAVAQYHSRKRETPLGSLMVTDLNSFPPSLMVIPVPGGDIKRHREDFIVNENLKRLGCSGRAGLKLQHPSTATEAKFHQLYRTSERVPLYNAVIELVKQCQMALMIFECLAPEYVDGLLCDVTETAIGDWWADIGFDLYNIEPNDGVLGATTVAALLGTLLGARNRLHAFGAPVAKDAFDMSNLKRSIGRFQKWQKLKKTRRLDRSTLDRLHRVTAKAAHSEGWTDAVKSRMAELGGQGGEMVMGMVRGRDKGGIADIETLDIDNFAQLVSGQRAKWLWMGKPRKGGIADAFASGVPASEMMFTTDEHGGYVWTSRKRHSDEELPSRRSFQGSERSMDIYEDRDYNRGRIPRKGVSGRVTDARIGFGRFKDAVGLPGLRSHHQRPSRDGVGLVADAAYLPSTDTEIEDPRHAAKVDDEVERDDRAEQVAREGHQPTLTLDTQSKPPAPEIVVEPDTPLPASGSPHEAPERQPQADMPDEGDGLEMMRTLSTAVSSDPEVPPRHAVMSLRRPQSCMDFNQESYFRRKDNYWPRHLSFSTVEDVVLPWERLGTLKDLLEPTTMEESIAQEDTLACDARVFDSRLMELSQYTVPWVERQVDAVDGLNQILYDRHEEVNAIYFERLGTYQQVRERSSDMLTEEHTFLSDNMKRVELSGAKLDYELNVLESKVGDVETGLAEFERHVTDLESRLKAIQGEEEKQSTSWLSRLGRLAGLRPTQ